MVQMLEQQLKEVGSKLESPPSTKVALLKLLKQAATCLSEIKQSPTISILESMQSFLKGIDKPELLKHQDRDVNFLVATCICEINRITSPEEPFDDECLKVLVEKYTTETLAEGIKRSLCIKDPGALKDHGASCNDGSTSTLQKLLLHEVRVQGAFKGYVNPLYEDVQEDEKDTISSNVEGNGKREGNRRSSRRKRNLQCS